MRMTSRNVAFERAGGFGGDARTGEVGLAAHHGSDGAGKVAALVAIVGHAHGHQQRAEVGETQPQRAERVGVFADSLGGIAGVIDNDFLRHDHGVDGVAEGLHVELAIGADELHEVQGRKIARRIVQKHVLRAGVGGVDAGRVLARMPAVDCGIELHAGVAALVGGFGDGAQDLARFVALDGLSGGHAFGPPVAIARGGFHEIVGGAHGIVGVLEEDGAVGVAVDRRIVAGLHQGVGFLLFLGLAPDELFDVGVVGVEDHHFGGAARFAAGLDDAGEGVEALHKRERPGGAPAARQNGIFLAQGREVRAGARAPFEQHALGFGQVEDGFERILHRNDETGRALRPRSGGTRARLELGDAVGLAVVNPAVAAGFAHADVEPDGRIEAGLLGDHEVGQFEAEVFGVGFGLEVAVLFAPTGDGIDHALDELGHAGFAFRGAHLAVKILAGDDIGGRLGPVHGNFDIALLEDNRAFIVSDGGSTGLPLDFVVGGLAALQSRCKVPGEGNSCGTRCRIILHFFHFRTQCHSWMSHLKLSSGFPAGRKRLRNSAPRYGTTSRTLSICSVLRLRRIGSEAHNSTVKWWWWNCNKYYWGAGIARGLGMSVLIQRLAESRRAEQQNAGSVNEQAHHLRP
jgi:hypothetical protein